MVREIVERTPQARFDRAHFQKFGDSSLDFEVVFWMTDPDYNKYMDAQQAINLALVRRFEQEKIGFAYPTRSLFVEAPLRVELASRS
jgi:small-conductance mechanosensitive channel